MGTAGGGAGQLSTPGGLDIDASGNIYVADQNNTRIAEFEPDGDFIRAFGSDVELPDGGAALETCETMCQPGAQGSGAGQMFPPSSVALGAANKLYVADGFNNRVSVFNVGSPDVTFDRAFGFDVLAPGDDLNFESCSVSCIAGDPGSAAGALDEPDDLAFDGAGKLYVADSANHRISVIDVSGSSPAFLRAFGWDVSSPDGGTGLEDCTTGSGCLAGDVNGGAGSLDAPRGLGLDGPGRLYVTESGSVSGIHRVSVFDVSSTTTTGFIRAFGGDVASPPNMGSPFEICPLNGSCLAGEPFGTGGAFNFPADAAVDPAGTLYVADSMNQRIDVFDASTPNVTFTRAFGRDVLDPPDGTGFEICSSVDVCVQGDTGTAPGEMSYPSDVVVDCRGAIWVSEPPGNRLQRFGEPGTGACPLAPASISVAPTTKDFGSTQVGTPTGATEFVVTNTGEVTSGTLATTLTGLNASQFGITQDGCAGTTLDGDEDCSVFARFAPSAAGTDRTASLNVAGVPGGTTSAALSGDATAVPTPPTQSTPAANTPGATGQQAAALKKCKKKKGAARKKCKKKAKKLPV